MSAEQGSKPRVEITHRKLYFPLPIPGPVENIVRMINREDKDVGIKFRTNAITRFTVRPPRAVLRPREEVTVRFVLDVKDGKLPDADTHDWFVLEARFFHSGDNVADKAFWARKVPCLQLKIDCCYRDRAKIPSKVVVQTDDKLPPASAATAAAATGETPFATEPPGEAIPITRREGKPPNPQNPDYVADAYKYDTVGGSVLGRFFTTTIPLPFTILLLVLSFLAAVYERNTYASQTLERLLTK